MKTLARTGIIAVVALAAAFSGCKKEDCPEPTPPPPPAQSLYNQVGGTTMVADPNFPGTMIEQGYLSIRSVVDSSLMVVAADPVLMPSFAVLLAELPGNTTGFTELSKNVTDFFAFNAGSANHIYEGMSMHDTHNPTDNPRMTGLATNAQMDAFIADVVTGAQQNAVPDAIIAQFGALMESLRTTIVQG